jgi:hypothetical protein
VEREEREQQDQVARNAAAERREERAIAREEHIESLADEALDIEEPAVPSGPEIVE